MSFGIDFSNERKPKTSNVSKSTGGMRPLDIPEAIKFLQSGNYAELETKMEEIYIDKSLVEINGLIGLSISTFTFNVFGKIINYIDLLASYDLEKMSEKERRLYETEYFERCFTAGPESWKTRGNKVQENAYIFATKEDIIQGFIKPLIEVLSDYKVNAAYNYAWHREHENIKYFIWLVLNLLEKCAEQHSAPSNEYPRIVFEFEDFIVLVKGVKTIMKYSSKLQEEAHKTIELIKGTDLYLGFGGIRKLSIGEIRQKMESL
jgi:hypothetical protein